MEDVEKKMEEVKIDPKKVQVDDFDTLKLIGRGAFGEVRLVRKKRQQADLCYEENEKDRNG